jgi:hypothetical protein
MYPARLPSNRPCNGLWLPRCWQNAWRAVAFLNAFGSAARLFGTRGADRDSRADAEITAMICDILPPQIGNADFSVWCGPHSEGHLAASLAFVRHCGQNVCVESRNSHLPTRKSADPLHRSTHPTSRAPLPRVIAGTGFRTSLVRLGQSQARGDIQRGAS